MAEFGLVGGTYQSEALGADAQETINLYPEAVESGSGRSKYVLLGTPGITLLVTLPKSPCRGIFAGDGVFYVVAGNSLYQVFANGTYTDRSAMSGASAIANDGKPVDFAVNGNQLLVVGGGNVYCDSGSGPVIQYFTSQLTDQIVGPGANQLTTATNTNTFDSTDIGNKVTITGGLTGTWNPGTYTITAVDGSGNPTLSGTVGTVGSTGGQGWETMLNDGTISASHCCFLDSYFIISGKNVTSTQTYGPRAIYISMGWNGTQWSATDYAVKEGWPDNIARIIADHEELWIFGDIFSTEIWRNEGNQDFPFVRDPGAFIHQACIAEWTPVSIQNGVAWLGGDTRGQIQAWFASGFQPVRISNHAVEKEWSTYSQVSDAVAYNYTERGHSFWVISFPMANATWAWDALTNLWHKRGWWNGSSWDRQRQAYHGYVNAFEKHYVCDWQTGAVYTMDKGVYTDNGTAIYFKRTAPYIASELDRFSIDELRLDYKYDPALTITLAASYDEGATWTAEKTPSGLKVFKDNAASIAGCAWRRQGQSRPRLFRLTGSGNAARQLVGAYINPQD